MPGSTFVVVADPALLPTVLGRPGLPKSRVYELGFFVSNRNLHILTDDPFQYMPIHAREQSC
jgi:hypothetical protein